jgi:hypothetical protein
MARSYQGYISTKIEVEIDADNTAFPQIEIRYSCTPGYSEMGPSYASGGEPACGPEIEFIRAVIVDGDGLSPTVEETDKWAEAYLASDTGFNAVIEDLRGYVKK